MFKDVRYADTNMSVKVIDGHILLRYWLLYWKVDAHDYGKCRRAVACLSPGTPDASDRRAVRDNCRLSVQLNGVQGHIYNHQAYYDRLYRLLVDRTDARDQPDSELISDVGNTGGDSVGRGCDEAGGAESPIASAPATGSAGADAVVVPLASMLGGEREGKPVWLKFIPAAYINIYKSLLVIGGVRHKAACAVEIRVAKGVLSSSDSPSRYDLYQRQLKMVLQDTRVRLFYNTAHGIGVEELMQATYAAGRPWRVAVRH